jgi:hypothetical protein
MKLICTALLLLSCSLTFATKEKVPRQKVYIKGQVKNEAVFKMNELEKLGTVEKDILDPYSNYENIKFTGIYLHEIFSKYALPNAKAMEVIAINDYKVDITYEEAKKEKMIVAFKGNGKYLTVSQRGPARIVIPGKGRLEEGALAKEGINWVWFVKTIVIK